MEPYADYGGQLSEEDVKDILQSDRPMDTFFEIMYEYFSRYEADEYSHLFRGIRERLDMDNDQESEVFDYITAEVYIEYPYDVYLDKSYDIDSISRYLRDDKLYGSYFLEYVNRKVHNSCNCMNSATFSINIPLRYAIDLVESFKDSEFSGDDKAIVDYVNNVVITQYEKISKNKED
jgi:hypothetical protein